MKQAGDRGASNNHNNTRCRDLLANPGLDLQDMSQIPADIENRQRQRPIRHGRHWDLVDTSQQAARSLEQKISTYPASPSR